MNNSRHPKLLVLIFALNTPIDELAEVGNVGRVVELRVPDAVELEFLDRHDRTRSVARRAASDVLALNRIRTFVT